MTSIFDLFLVWVAVLFVVYGSDEPENLPELWAEVSQTANDPEISEFRETEQQTGKFAVFTRSVPSPSLHRQLKQKRKRLRRLRIEVRELREKLHDGISSDDKNGTSSLDSPILGSNLYPKDESASSSIPENIPSTHSAVPKKRRKHKKRGWRRQLLKHLKKLNRKLDTVTTSEATGASQQGRKGLNTSEAKRTRNLVEEAERAIRRRPRKKNKKNKNRKQSVVKKELREEAEKPINIKKPREQKRGQNRRKGKKKPLISRTAQEVENQKRIAQEQALKYKLNSLHSSRKAAKRGEQGYACSAHSDCRPGLCCHESAISVDFPNDTLSSESPTVNKSQCVWHAMEEGGSCMDSCQCASGMHCYSEKPGLDGPVDGKFDISGVCKIAATADFMHGEYLNAKNSMFHEE